MVFAAFLGAVVGVIVASLVLFDFAGKYGFAEKTLWNYLDVFLVPVVVAAATALLTLAQSRRQRRDEEAQEQRALAVENERAQDEALQAYLDQMGELVLKEGLRTSQEGTEVRVLARARTLTVLERLGASRKMSVMRFLMESALISEKSPVLGLREADLGGTDLSGADLSWANLSHANLRHANLSEADLIAADLSWADLSEANLSGANLSEANLRHANLRHANLSWADLREAKLRGANLSEADLREARGWTMEQIAAAEALEGATMPNGQKYEDWLKTKGSGEDRENTAPS